jgi:hypothetical protein
VTTLTNQRLHVAQICYTWNNTVEYPHLSGRMGSGILGSKSKASGGATGHKGKIAKTVLGGGVGGEGTGVVDGDEAAGGGGAGGGEGGGGDTSGAVDIAGEQHGTRMESTDNDHDETVASHGMDGTGSAPPSSSSAGSRSGPGTGSGTGTGTGTGTGVIDDSYYPYLDAKITGWNLRDKKTAGGKMTYLRKNNFQFEGDRKKNFVEIYKQVRIVDLISGISTALVIVYAI